MFLFSSGQVCAVARLRPQNIDDWCNKEIIKPHRGGGQGKGAGNRRLFTPYQTLSLVVANQVRQSEAGCVLSYVGTIVEAFGAVDEEWLAEQFAEGNTHLAAIVQGKPILREPLYDWVNVQAAWKKVSDFIASETEAA